MLPVAPPSRIAECCSSRSIRRLGCLQHHEVITPTLQRGVGSLPCLAAPPRRPAVSVAISLLTVCVCVDRRGGNDAPQYQRCHTTAWEEPSPHPTSPLRRLVEHSLRRLIADATRLALVYSLHGNARRLRPTSLLPLPATITSFAPHTERRCLSEKITKAIPPRDLAENILPSKL